MTQRPTSKDVFVQAVKDHLDGTPHAHHPVQFESINAYLDRCSLCFSVVHHRDQGGHRKWHDEHVRVHDQILEQSQQHVPEPRYGGR